MNANLFIHETAEMLGLKETHTKLTQVVNGYALTIYDDRWNEISIYADKEHLLEIANAIFNAFE